MISRVTWRADLLVLLGLILIGAAVWTWWQLPGILAYAGVLLVATGGTSAQMTRERLP